MVNPRSSSVTGKYSEASGGYKHGNLLGAGALSSAANSSNIQPSLEGFGGIVGVSAGGGKGAMSSVGSKQPPTSVTN